MDAQLAELAAAHGVAIEYEDQLRRRIQVPDRSVVAVLAALGVPATDAAQVRASLAAVRAAPPRPAVLVHRPSAPARVAATDGPVLLELEDGGHLELAGAGDEPIPCPPDLPVGWHRVRTADLETGLIAAPDRLPARTGRQWGWATQLYALPSRQSWGVGDLGDLAVLAEWTAAHGGGLVLVNPLHAVSPVPPMPPSPYYPASRRWINPLYLRVEECSAYLRAPADVRAAVDALRVAADGDRVDRDRAWAAKSAALQVLFASADAPGVEAAMRANSALRDFAVWAALSELHGGDWRRWPERLRRPGTPAVASAAAAVADRVGFHAWLQLLCSEQLAAVRSRSERAGLAVGIVHDLAIGCDPAGADAWSLQDALALGARMGAPPDSFNQQGQDWGMPPWHPRRLAELGYLPLRDLLRATLAHAGGIRIDHVLGLFRMWWVPDGATPRDGTYVQYDADALLATVMVEAQRAAAVVIGEDLGTVPRSVRRVLAERGILGTSVLWFERAAPKDGSAGPLRPPATWREAAAASVSTHDLPTARGWLRGVHVELRTRLGLLDDADQETTTWQRERAELVALLRSLGLVGAAPDEDELVRALHLALTLTPSRYLLASPGDAVGDLRQSNLPATTEEYPSWKLRVTDQDGRPLLLEELLADPRVARLAADLTLAVR